MMTKTSPAKPRPMRGFLLTAKAKGPDFADAPGRGQSAVAGLRRSWQVSSQAPRKAFHRTLPPLARTQPRRGQGKDRNPSSWRQPGLFRPALPHFSRAPIGKLPLPFLPPAPSFAEFAFAAPQIGLVSPGKNTHFGGRALCVFPLFFFLRCLWRALCRLVRRNRASRACCKPNRAALWPVRWPVRPLPTIKMKTSPQAPLLARSPGRSPAVCRACRPAKASKRLSIFGAACRAFTSFDHPGQALPRVIFFARAKGASCSAKF